MIRDSMGGAPRASLQVSREHYEEFRAFLEKACGIVLGDHKQYLVASRLAGLLADYQIPDLHDLIRRMQLPAQRALREAVVDAMTTNETLWFRDVHPFNILRDRLLPELQRTATPVRIWSAACSSGQEPYSISMTVEEFRSANPGALRQQVEIVATDLSRQMLDACKTAEYDQLSLGRGLSRERLTRHFEQVAGGQRWRVRRDIAQRVRFQALNLLDSYLALGRFDIVFCRNVLIYFSGERKADILRRIHATLKPGGYLILGASEGLTDIGDKYQMVQCNPGIIYKAI